MRFFLSILLLLCVSVASAADTFEGTWLTKERRLDGRMTAVVKDLGGDQWSARFYGRWQGVDYDYTVKFAGKPDKLTGKATIDGARYDWKGSIDEKKFAGTFTGDRYNGSFDLSRKK